MDFEARLRLGVRQFRVFIETLNFQFCVSSKKKTKRLWEKREEKEAHKITERVDFKKKKKNNGEKDFRRAEEEEEEGERRAREGTCGGNGAVEAWTDQDMDGFGGASQGCVCLACLVEIEYDRSDVLFKGE